MPPRSKSGWIQVGVDVLKTVRNAVTKSILAQIGDVVSAKAESDDVEWWQHVGLASRPPKPDAGKAACQVIVIRESDHDAAIASRDLRGQALAGSLDDGETCLYAAGSDGKAQARVLLKANGNLALYTAKGNAEGGASVTIQCNADGTINLASSFGVIQIAESGITIMSAAGPGAGVQISATGVALLGTQLALNASSVGLGAAPSGGVLCDQAIGLQALLISLATLTQSLNAIVGTPNATALAATAPVDPTGALSTAVTASITAITPLLAVPLGSLSVKCTPL